MSGNILDVYPDNKNNVMVTWLIADGKPVKITERYTPSFYVYSSEDNLYTIGSILRDLAEVKSIKFAHKKIILGSEKKKLVLEIVPKKLESLRKLAEIVDSWGGYYRYQLYDVDTRLSTRYLQDKGVFFNASVDWDGKKFTLNDEQWAIDYMEPKYKKTTLEIERRTKSKVVSFDVPIKSIKIGDRTIIERDEALSLIHI